MGAITASLVARRDGASVAYVAGLLAQGGTDLARLLRSEPMLCPGVAAALERRDGLDFWTGAEAFGLDPAHLRGQALAPYFEPLEDPLPGPYVVCARDRVVSPQWGREAAPRLLGHAALELDCGHDAHRERPQALAELLGA
jgi:hypothetical protein